MGEYLLLLPYRIILKRTLFISRCRVCLLASYFLLSNGIWIQVQGHYNYRKTYCASQKRKVTWTLLFALGYIHWTSAAYELNAKMKVVSTTCRRDDNHTYTCSHGSQLGLRCHFWSTSHYGFTSRQVVKKPFKTTQSYRIGYVSGIYEGKFDACADAGEYVCQGHHYMGGDVESKPITFKSAGDAPALSTKINNRYVNLEYFPDQLIRTDPRCPRVATRTWLCGGDTTVGIGCEYPCSYQDDIRYIKSIVKKATGSGPDKVVTIMKGSYYDSNYGKFSFNATGDENDVRGPGQYVCQVTDTTKGAKAESRAVSLQTESMTCRRGCSGRGRCVPGYNYTRHGDNTVVTVPDICHCNYPYSGPDCQYRKCQVYTDPHYTTFDGLWMPFQDECNFIMAQDKDAEHFKVVTYHEGGGVSFVRRLTITIGSGATPPFVVQLLQGRRIKVKEGAGSFSDITGVYNQTADDGFDLKIEHVPGRGSSTYDRWVVLSSERAGLLVDWNGKSAANVYVNEDTYKGQMEGLCGNFDDDKTNDLTPRGGPTYTTHITGRDHYRSHHNDYGKFGRSWNTTGSCQSRRKKAAASTNKCEGDANLQTSVEESCNFEEFRDFADPATLQAACVLDQCHGCGDYCRSEMKAVIARNVALQNNTQEMPVGASNDAADESGDSTGTIIGVVFGCLVLVGCVIGAFWWWKKGRQAAPVEGAGEAVGAGRVSSTDDQPGVTSL